MIKKLLIAVVMVACLPAIGFAQKFGVVNTQTLIESMPEMATARTQLEASSKKYDEEYKSLLENLQKSIAEFQKIENDANTPQSIKDRRVADIQGMQQKIEEFRATAQGDLEKQQQQLMAPIQQKLVDAVKAVGAEDNFTMIFENVMPVYTGADVVDITAKVKTRLGIK